MSAVSDQAHFTAREFLARFEREMGVQQTTIVAERMLFAFEMGYLRGHGEGLRAASAMYDELDEQTRKKVTDGDPK